MRKWTMTLAAMLAMTSWSVGQAQSAEQGGAEGEAVPVVDQSQVPPAEQYPQQQQPPGYQQGQPQYGQPQYGQPQYAQPQYAQPQPRLRRQRIRYHEGMDMPPGAEITSRPKLGMLIPGAIMFAVPYIFTAMAYAISQDASGGIDPTILIPAVGPFIQIPDASSAAARTGLAWDGILQTVGLVLLVVGAIPRKYVTYYAGGNPDQRLTVAPRFGGRGGGLDLSLAF